MTVLLNYVTVLLQCLNLLLQAWPKVKWEKGWGWGEVSSPIHLWYVLLIGDW